MEEFRKVFESYEISNWGRCRRRLASGRYKEVKGTESNRGYLYFQLQRDGKRRNFSFHNLVAKAFIGEPPDGMEVDHINRQRLDNRLQNLRYVTHQTNIRNSSAYRDDIEEQDKRKRANLLARLRYHKKKDIGDSTKNISS